VDIIWYFFFFILGFVAGQFLPSYFKNKGENIATKEDIIVMAPFNWRVDPTDLIKSFEARHKNPASGALFFWAVWSVESLHYLDDIDRTYDTSHATIGGHRPDIVDVAHARWATATCTTALDLCAAGLGRAFCQQQGTRELALKHFAPNQDRRKKLPPAARKWVDAVHADPKYQTIKQSRNFLTHSRIPRHFTLATAGPPQRLELELDGTKVGVRQLIEDARDCATRHVSEFVEKLPQLLAVS